jgi:surface protein
MLLLTPAPRAHAADDPFSQTYTVNVTILDSSLDSSGTGTGTGLPAVNNPGTSGSQQGVGTSGFPVTGDSMALIIVVLVIGFIGLVLVAVGARRLKKETKGILAISLAVLVALSSLGILRSVAYAAPDTVINVSIDKARTTSGTATVSVDGTATQSRYADITAALAAALPNMTLKLEGIPLDTTTKNVQEVADPSSNGIYTLAFAVELDTAVAVGSSTTTLTVTVADKRADVKIGGVVVVDKYYDANTVIEVIGTPTLEGAQAGHDISVASVSYRVDDASVGTKDVKVSGTLTGADAFKYLLRESLASTVPKKTVIISPKPVTISGTTARDKAYDASTAATIDDPGTLVGIAPGDDVTIVPGTATFDSASVGANKAVTFSGFTLGGTQAGNYTLTSQPAATTASITGAASDDIILTAVITASNQTVGVNKYFTNVHTVDWGDGSPVEDVTANITHTYAATGTYTVTLASALTGQGFGVWTFGSSLSLSSDSCLVPGTSQTTASSVAVSYLPPMTAFLINATTAPDYFFAHFNYWGALTSLPVDSFDTSNITTVGDHFFSGFNAYFGTLTSLPSGSFNTGNITTAGNYFFYQFNYRGALTSLPNDSFNTGNITTAGNYFFSGFNHIGTLTSLPAQSFKLSAGLTAAGNYFFRDFNSSGTITSLPVGSFDTSNITTVGDQFFAYFNAYGLLTSLPSGSFRLSPSLTIVPTGFFSGFNSGGALTSLPAGSFDASNITTAGNSFFSRFTYAGSLTSLPAGSFDTSNITTVGNYFFESFNNGGSLTSLPVGSFKLNAGLTAVGNDFFAGFTSAGSLTSLPSGSFNTDAITTVGASFFINFNYLGKLTSLPSGSFNTGAITTVGGSFFQSFNGYGSLTSLPAGSFNTGAVTTTGGNFFYGFNDNGKLTSLPVSSFKLSTSLVTVNSSFFRYFNNDGALTSLPADSFNTGAITTAGGEFFGSFNANGKLSSLPAGSFDISNITREDGYFFSGFNATGSLTGLPDDSFKLSVNLTSASQGAFSGFNQNGALASLPAGSFDASNITTMNGSFFDSFNYGGKLASLPATFKWPTVSDAYEVSSNFKNAFNSPSYTLNRSAVDIINGSTAPLFNNSAFSSNQPGYDAIDPNWRA